MFQIVDEVAPCTFVSKSLSVFQIRWPTIQKKATAVCLLQHFGSFSAPSQLLYDRGSHFVNSLI